MSRHPKLLEIQDRLSKREPDLLDLRVKLYNARHFRCFEGEHDYKLFNSLMSEIRRRLGDDNT